MSAIEFVWLCPKEWYPVIEITDLPCQRATRVAVPIELIDRHNLALKEFTEVQDLLLDLAADVIRKGGG